MFQTLISSTPLCTPSAHIYFADRINSYQNDSSDTSFISTLRALLVNRIPEGGSVDFYSKVLPSGSPTDAAFLRQIRTTADSLTVYFCAKGSEWLNYARQNFTQRFASDYVAVDKVTAFFHKEFDSQCYIDPKTRSSIVFVASFEPSHLHYMQCGIPAFLPWYFSREEGLSDLEMELINSLRERSSRHYMTVINRFADQLNLRDATVRQLLSGFENKFVKIELQKAGESMRRIESEMQQIEDQLTDLLRQRRELQIRTFGLSQAGENRSSDLMDYFLADKNLVLEEVNGTTVRFGVRTKLRFFDDEAAEATISNRRSLIYDAEGCSKLIDDDDMERFMRAVFVDKSIAIRFSAKYALSLDGVRAQSGAFNGDYQGYMPNPHIENYHCMGDYLREVNAALMASDYVTAVMSCVASAQSLNFGDYTVLSAFMRRIRSTNGGDADKFVELPDGRVVTVIESIKYLKEVENNG